jgi:type 1 glutamine amidotransferase
MTPRFRFQKSAVLPLTCALVAVGALFSSVQQADAQEKKKIVFIAGKPSHPSGAHEHRAGSMLLAGALEKSGLPVETQVVEMGWPKDASVFNGASAIVIYADGGKGHPAMEHLKELRDLASKGVGIGCIHYGVEVPKGEGGEAFLDLIGGYFETDWSVNPHWDAKFKMPKHEVTQGVKDFGSNDEWYYHMRFRENMEGITPILTDLPPASSLERKDGAHENNPAVRAAVLERKEPQHVMWVYDRPAKLGGGRAFGFTGGHFHKGWAQDDQRTVVLNAIVWIAGVKVPEAGVPSKTPTEEELKANLDKKG